MSELLKKHNRDDSHKLSLDSAVGDVVQEDSLEQGAPGSAVT